MAISLRTRKALWGRSGNQCALCRCPLVMLDTGISPESVVGEECHIVAAGIYGPRADESFPIAERDCCENLILLCPAHHKIVDDHPDLYPADKLRHLKSIHEKRVRDLLAGRVRRPVQFGNDGVVVSPGEQGNLECDTVLHISLRARNALPHRLEVRFDGFTTHWWRILGARYDPDDGKLSVAVKKDECLEDNEVSLLLIAPGFQRETVQFNLKKLSAQAITLKRCPPVAVEISRILTCEEDSLSVEAVIANRRREDTWINRVTFLGLGTTNSVCNPNPIPTFRYELSLALTGTEICGETRAPGDTLGLPVKGHLKHVYGDGYLVFSFEQVIKVPSKDRISYILTFRDVALDLTGATPPNFSFFGQANDADAPIPRLGLTTTQFSTLAKASGPRRVPAREFFLGCSDRGPSYWGPSWSSLLLVFHSEDNQVFPSRFFANGFCTDLISDVLDELVHLNVSESGIAEIWLEAYK